MRIKIENLTKVHKDGTQALKDITLELGSGMFGLLGPNGAGKTTLMRIIATLLKPTQGKVVVNNIDVSKEQDKLKIKKKLGYLPQELGLYPELSAYQFLDYMALLKQIYNAKERRQQVEELLRLVGLDEAKKRKIRTFSGGMKRRLGVAQALLGEPELLIVDEPTAGLDPEERVRFRNLLARLSMNKTVILSTHIVEDVAHTCSDIAVINCGSLLFRGNPQALIDQARGKVWLLRNYDEGLLEKVRVISMNTGKEGKKCRLVAEPEEIQGYDVVAQEPTLEEGYIYLLKKQEEQLGGGVLRR